MVALRGLRGEIRNPPGRLFSFLNIFFFDGTKRKMLKIVSFTKKLPGFRMETGQFLLLCCASNPATEAVLTGGSSFRVSTLVSLRRRVRNGHDRTSRRKRRLLSSVAVSSFPTSDDVAGWLPEKMGEKRGAGLRLVLSASDFRQVPMF